MVDLYSLERLMSFPIFVNLASSDIQELLLRSRKKTLENGESYFSFGDKVLNFSVLCEGAIQLYRETRDGHELTKEILIVGDTIGDEEILLSSPTHQFNALAIKDAILLEFPIAWLKENLKKNSSLALNLLAKLAHKSHIATMEAEHKGTMMAAQQVSCFLERLCVLHDFDPRGFELPYSKTMIASRLGMELETFSRALSKVREHGIRVEGNRISFENILAAEEYACADCTIVDNCAEHNELKERLNITKPKDVGPQSKCRGDVS